MRGRYTLTVFWTIAALVSLLEPIGQALPLARHMPTLALTVAVIEYGGNLVLAGLLLRFGWAALLVARLLQELTWHVVWPALGH